MNENIEIPQSVFRGLVANIAALEAAICQESTRENKLIYLDRIKNNLRDCAHSQDSIRN